MTDGRVDCARHGLRQRAYICGHALAAFSRGAREPFFWTDAEAEEPCGWCADCHARYLAEGEEWTGEAEDRLDARLICIDCFRAVIDQSASA